MRMQLDFAAQTNSTSCIYVPMRPLGTSDLQAYISTNDSSKVANSAAIAAASALPLVKASYDAAAAAAPILMVGQQQQYDCR